MIKKNPLKTQFAITDIRKARLSLIHVGDRPGCIAKIRCNGEAVGIDMTEKDLRKLQAYLNKRFAAKKKKRQRKQTPKMKAADRMLERAIKNVKVCKKKTAMFDRIFHAVCAEMVLFPECVTNGLKHRKLCDARIVATYLVRKHTDLSYPDIADLFGEKSHASALLRVRKYKELQNNGDDTLERIAQAVERELGL